MCLNIQDRVRTKFVGANGFLGKPIQPELILKTIDKYLGVKQSNKTADYIDKIRLLILKYHRIRSTLLLRLLNKFSLLMTIAILEKSCQCVSINSNELGVVEVISKPFLPIYSDPK